MEIAISITEGRTVRDLFYNGLLDDLIHKGYTISIFTEAVTVKKFIQEFEKPEISFRMLHKVKYTRQRKWAYFIRRRIIERARWLLQGWLKFEEKHYYPPHQEYLDYFQQKKPQLLLTTHAHFGDGI